MTVSAIGRARLEAGHPWVYRSDVQGPILAARWAPLVDGRGRALGWGAVHPTSQIAVRRFHASDEPVTRDDVVRRVRAAVQLRAALLASHAAAPPPPGPVSGYRLVHAEADGLPGLVVDRLGEALVVRNGCAAMEPHVSDVVATLVDMLSPEHVILRHDGPDRAREGLDVSVTAAYGSCIHKTRFHDGWLTWSVDPSSGQKTGAYLDQRVNHALLGARGQGRVLDVFSHHGGFGLHALRGGAESLVAIDASHAALEGARRAASANGLPPPTVRRGDAGQELRALLRSGDRFDVVSVDPPAFAKRARDLRRAEAAYKDVNLHAMRLLAPGGTLASSTCSHHLSDAAFANVLSDAAADAGRTFRVLDRRGAAPDHVERLGFPESSYLKFVLLEAVDG